MGVISFYSLLETGLMLHIKITFAFSGSHESQPGVTDQYTQDFLRIFNSQGKSCYDLKGHDLAFSSSFGHSESSAPDSFLCMIAQSYSIFLFDKLS